MACFIGSMRHDNDKTINEFQFRLFSLLTLELEGYNYIKKIKVLKLDI